MANVFKKISKIFKNPFTGFGSPFFVTRWQKFATKKKPCLESFKYLSFLIGTPFINGPINIPIYECMYALMYNHIIVLIYLCFNVKRDLWEIFII